MIATEAGVLPLVDSLDTLLIMDLKDEFTAAVNAAVQIEFSDREQLADNSISIFETTIRYLGGFIAAHELSSCKDTRLLDKATELGDMLYAAFDTPSRMPTNSFNPQRALAGREQPPSPNDNVMANIATLTMEFTRLSQLTGDTRYYDAVQRITNLLEEQQSKTKLPGLWPKRYDNQRMDFTTMNGFTLGAEQDSGYEYLLKMVLLLGGKGSEVARQYEGMYKYSMDTAIQHLLFRPMLPDNSDVLLPGSATVYDGVVDLALESEHLACFAGGMLSLGGKLFNNMTHLDVGRKLTDGCVWAYEATPSGIAPETFTTVRCPSTTECEWNEALWQSVDRGLPKGFANARDPRYLLRPGSDRERLLHVPHQRRYEVQRHRVGHVPKHRLANAHRFWKRHDFECLCDSFASGRQHGEFLVG